jgi:hypothetical protein
MLCCLIFAFIMERNQVKVWRAPVNDKPRCPWVDEHVRSYEYQALASILGQVRVEGERFGDHGDDNFQVFHCCDSSGSHCLHHASGSARDGDRSWDWGRRWRCTTESWASGICPHEGLAHRFPGSFPHRVPSSLLAMTTAFQMVNATWGLRSAAVDCAF